MYIMVNRENAYMNVILKRSIYWWTLRRVITINVCGFIVTIHREKWKGIIYKPREKFHFPHYIHYIVVMCTCVSLLCIYRNISSENIFEWSFSIWVSVLLATQKMENLTVSLDSTLSSLYIIIVITFLLSIINIGFGWDVKSPCPKDFGFCVNR